LQRWCENGGYIEGEAPIDLDVSQPTDEVVGAFARFLKWYAEGRKGDANAARKGGRKVCVWGGLMQPSWRSELDLVDLLPCTLRRLADALQQ
jgi:hypothetical protein